MMKNICGGKTIKAGLKQSLRTIKAGKAKRVYIALDADSYVLRNVIEVAKKHQIDIVEIESMKELGKMAGIDIGTAVAVQTDDER